MDKRLEDLIALSNDFLNIGIPVANISAGNNDRSQRDRAMKLWDEWKKKAEKYFTDLNSEAI